MKNSYFRIFFLLSCVCFPVNSSNGETFCVNSATMFQAKLDEASANNESDTIQIIQGAYNRNLFTEPFSYNSDNPGDITIEGGYVKKGILCIMPRPAPSASKTVINAGYSDRALLVRSNRGYNITIKRLTIRNGYADNGAGLSAESYGSLSHPHSGLVEISYNIIEDNQTVGGGGGIYAVSSTEYGSSNAIFITNNIIKNNSANFDGAGIDVSSGATPGKTALIHIEGNIIANNEGLVDGGGVKIGSTGIGGGTGAIRIEKNYIHGNVSYSGGGISLDSYTNSADAGAIDIINNFIYENVSSSYGGGVDISLVGDHPNGNTIFTHNTITGNQAGTNGGGINQNSKTLTFRNNIVWGNMAKLGGDIYFSPVQVNAIAHNNDIGEVFSNWDETSNNINLNPLFIGNGDYHLQVSSPCRNKGSTNYFLPTTDIDGDDRILFGLPDLGADENTQPYDPFPWVLFLPKITAKKQAH